MKIKKKIISLIAVALITSSAVVGCGSTNKTDESNKTQAGESQSTTREFTDMAGRTVEIPNEVNTVMVTSPVGQIAIYTIAPEKLAGWVYELSDNEKKFIDSKYHDLPVLGGNYGGGNVLNPEVVVKTQPDVLLDIGQISDSTVEDLDDLQDQTGVPVLAVGLDMDLNGDNNISETYKMLGDILGEEERANELATYSQEVLDEVKEKASTIKDEDKVNIYYAEGPEGLQTEGQGSTHAQVITMIGANNVADIEDVGGAGQAEVSLEQVIKWNPDAIVMSSKATELYNSFEEGNEDKWSSIKAVSDGKYYIIPDSPFNWFDRPPSVNRLIGVKWFGNLIYPDVYDYDMVEETKEFYKLFYHYDLSDEEAEELLSTSTLK